MQSVVHQDYSPPCLKRVDQIISQQTHSRITLANQMVNDLFTGKGKRIRAQLVVHISKAMGSLADSTYQLAAIIELIHAATLLHDDVIDQSSLRRGKPTTCSTFGNAGSVLAGDFLYSSAFRLISELDHPAILRHLANTTSQIVEGEIDQLALEKQLITEAQYLSVIEAKTGLLFAASTKCAALLHSDQADEIEIAGRKLGIGYQIIDDILDYQDNNAKWGKQVGDDLRQGKCTLPLIFLIENDPGFDITQLTCPTDEFVKDTISKISKSNILDTCRDIAVSYIDQAIVSISKLPHPDSAINLCEFIKRRVY